MPTAMYVKKQDVAEILKATFPTWNGKEVEISISDTVTFWGTMWDGGSRRVYKILRLADMAVVPIETAPFLRESDLHTSPHKLADGFIVVVQRQGGYSEGIEIITNSANVLPKLTVDTPITEDERIVLLATRSLKSSYAGISNYRFHAARGKTGITQERWDAAKAALIEKKFLNKAGAITTEGKNQITGQWFD